jgi:hypothetical protein
MSFSVADNSYTAGEQQLLFELAIKLVTFMSCSNHFINKRLQKTNFGKTNLKKFWIMPSQLSVKKLRKK